LWFALRRHQKRDSAKTDPAHSADAARIAEQFENATSTPIRQ
jgi:hypothetical protein